MMSIANTIYRVYVDGLNPTERTVFGGIIRLAERNRTIFQMEAILESSDVVILDGADQRSCEFVRSNSQIAQRVIWIDPPTSLSSSRVIKRPLRWPSLLELMEQIVGGNSKPVAAGPGVRALPITFDQLRSFSEDTLRSHIGIAAEFVLEDTCAEIKSCVGTEQLVSKAVFLDALRRQMPASLDADKVISEIEGAIQQAGLA